MKSIVIITRRSRCEARQVVGGRYVITVVQSHGSGNNELDG
jgi:hypothetical protein